MFVEAGAGSGVFKSHTTWLEASQDWTGLLVEPRPQAFAQLRRRRKAAAALACVSDEGYHKQVRIEANVEKLTVYLIYLLVYQSIYLFDVLFTSL